MLSSLTCPALGTFCGLHGGQSHLQMQKQVTEGSEPALRRSAAKGQSKGLNPGSCDSKAAFLLHLVHGGPLFTGAVLLLFC